MNMSPKFRLGLYLFLTAYFAFRFTSKLLTAFKTNIFDYFSLGISLLALVFVGFQVFKIAKSMNDSNDK